MKKKDIFVASSGVELELFPIQPFELQVIIDAVRNQHPTPPVPTYEVETIGGGKELHQHTEDTLETPEDKARWVEYTAKKNEADSAVGLATNDYLLLAGVKYTMPTNDGSWMKIQRRFGVQIPDDPDELALHYLKTRLLSPEDFTELLSRLMRKTGVDEKTVESAKNSFRDSVRRTRREDIRPTDDSAEGQMVHDTTLSGDKDGEGVGANA